VAALLAQASSKVVVATLLRMLEDEHPTVRAASARALAGFPTDRVKARLFAALTDDRFAVQKAVAETLGSFRLQRAAAALVRMFSSTGKRVPLAAADFIARCDAAPGAFEDILVDLDAQDEAARGVLALIFKRLLGDDAAVGGLAARLRSADRGEAAAAAAEVSDRLARFLLT
jgi:HEAT repeat protein